MAKMNAAGRFVFALAASLNAAALAGGYVVERNAGTVWQDGTFIGNGSHGVLAYAPSHLEWVINKNDVFDRRVARCEYVPHSEVMEYVRTNAVASVSYLARKDRIDMGDLKGDHLTSSVSAAILRIRFWGGVGWNAPAVPLVRQRLDMMEGTLDEEMSSPALSPQATTIVHRDRDVVAVRLRDRSNNGRLAVIEISRPQDPRMETAPAFAVDGDVVSFEQRMPYGDKYAVAMLVTGASAAECRGLAGKVSVNGASDLFIAARPSRTEAVAAVRDAAKATFDALRDGNSRWWRRFWQDGGRAEFTSEPEIDRNWKHSLFALAGQFGAVPMPALNGLVYGPLDPGCAGVGSNCYVHDQNVQIPLMPFFPVNRCSFVRPFVATYAACMDELKRRTAEMFGRDVHGAYLPLNMNAIGVEHPIGDYRYTLCGGAYSGLILAKAWRHSRDVALLKEMYPALKEFIRFYTDTMTRDENGTCHFVWSVPPEIFTGTKDELATIACLKTCLETAIEAAQTLKTDADDIALWKDILAHYPKFARHSGGGWWGGPDIPDDHYMYGGHLFYPFFPAEANLDREVAERTLAYAWTNAVEMAWTTDEPHPNHEWSAFYVGTARMRLHDPADGWKALTDFLGWFGKPNGLFSHNPVIVSDMTRQQMAANVARLPPLVLRGTNGKLGTWGRGGGLDLTANPDAKRLVCPVLEGGAAFLHMATEALLQSWGGEIRLFPCVPPKFTGRFENLLAQGGYTVSAEMKDGRLVDYSIGGVDGSAPIKVTCPTDPEFVQLPGEPAWKKPIAPAAFPDVLSAYVFRNWGLVEPQTLADAIGAKREDVVRIAEEMGLRRDVKVSPLWKTLGYVTILRRNWHLVPYSQLMALTGKSRREMRYALTEDDYLESKLGMPKPSCPRLEYSEALAAKGRAARLEIRRKLAEEGALPADGDDGDPRFSFLEKFGGLKPLPGDGRKAQFDLRMVYPFSADYGDVVGDDSLASCPEGLFADLAARGVNAVWLHAVLSELTTDPAYPEFGTQAARRTANLRRIVSLAGRHGVKVILYINEPRAQPSTFFDRPGREEMRGSRRTRRGNAYCCMCTRHPETLRWLRDSMAQLFRNVPNLGGVFTITMSENDTHCASAFDANNTCGRCKGRPYSEFILAVNEAIYDGVRSVSPDAHVIFYDTAWPDDAVRTVVPKLPKGGRLVLWSEKLLPFRQAGLDLLVNEYSISHPGPAPRAFPLWTAAREAGLKADAKLQVNTSWEMCATPYLPAMDLVAEHIGNLATNGIDGLMLSWSLGGFPSPNLALVDRFRGGGNDIDAILDGLAGDLYGVSAAGAVRAAWKRYSDAFRNYPIQWQTVYYSPVQLGPANLLYPVKTGWNATMVNTAYDDLKRWTDGYAANRGAWIGLMEAVAEGFDEGDRLWREAVGGMSGAARDVALREQSFFRAATLHFRSSADQARFIEARDGGDAVRMGDVARRELATAKEMLGLVLRESAIGYESSNRYMYVPNDMREKILVCRQLLGK